MRRLFFSLISLSLILLSATGTYAQSAKQDMKTLVKTMNQEMMELVKAGRYEALAKYYDAEAISLPNYRVMEQGFKLILNNSNGRKSGGYKVLDGQKTTVELFVGTDMMVDIGTYTLTMDFPGLPQPKVDNGKYMNVWRKDAEGNWRIIGETWNADKSPNAPAERGQTKPSQTPGSSIQAKPAEQNK